MKEELKFLGLSENEISIYIYLSNRNSANATEIRKNTQIANSRVYSALDSLISKGMVSYVLTARGKQFSAASAEILRSLFEERRQKIEEIIPSLKNKSKNEFISTCTVYEGFNGFRSALLNFVEECPNGENVSIIGFSNQSYKSEKLRLLLSSINTRSIEKKHEFRMILDSKENIFYKDRKLEGISKIRFMNNGFSSPAAMDIFGDAVYIFVWAEQPLAIVIKDKEVATGFKIYFDFLWKIAQK